MYKQFLREIPSLFARRTDTIVHQVSHGTDPRFFHLFISDKLLACGNFAPIREVPSRARLSSSSLVRSLSFPLDSTLVTACPMFPRFFRRKKNFSSTNIFGTLVNFVWMLRKCAMLGNVCTCDIFLFSIFSRCFIFYNLYLFIIKNRCYLMIIKIIIIIFAAIWKAAARIYHFCS